MLNNWLFAKRVKATGLVPRNYILILNEMLSAKRAKKIMELTTKTLCLFRRVILFKFTKKILAGVLEEHVMGEWVIFP